MKLKVKLDIYFDGACKNVKDSTKEPYGCGVAVYIDGIYSEEYSDSSESGLGTSNIAEWVALTKSCKIAEKLYSRFDVTELNIYGDSQLIVNQFNGQWSINNDNFHQYFSECHRILYKLIPEGIVIKWIKRDENKEADRLSKIALNNFKNNQNGTN